MRTAIGILLFVLTFGACAGAGTVVYSYDEQHRLAGANYNNQATVTYEYDKADNLTGFTVLTDSQYFKPFLLYFTMSVPEVRPLCWRGGFDPWLDRHGG